MANIFYYGSDGKVYGPETELTVQGWYANGFLSSDVKFQISQSKQHDPNGPVLTLGDLVDLNGRTLPFYFSTEKATQERKQEDTINQLKQEVDSLRTLCKNIQKNKDTSDEKKTIAVLQSQVASLVETQSDLLRRLDVLSSQKETSPVPAQLEKKVVEVKKRVDEQEKSITSMKKEISAVTSKCDRSDAKLDKLAEKQKEAEGSVDGYDKRIADLNESEKSLRESLSSCEQKVTSTADKIESIKSDLSEIRKELEDQNQKQKTAAVNNAVSVNEATEKHVEEEDDVPPWEKEEKGSSGMEKHDDEEPWNKINQNESDAARVKNEKAVTAVVPKSRTKNWDAICKELSDDDEEEEVMEVHFPLPTGKNVVQDVLNIPVPDSAKDLASVDQFMRMFRQYLIAMSTNKLDVLDRDECDVLLGLIKKLLECGSLSPEFITLGQRMLVDLPRLCEEMEIICWECPFRIFTPVNLLDHLVDPHHSELAIIKKHGTAACLFAHTMQRAVSKLSDLLRLPHSSLREEALNRHGERIFKSLKGNARLRPTVDFTRNKVDHYMSLACVDNSKAQALLEKAIIDGQLAPSDCEYLLPVIRKWFKEEKNRLKFLEDLDDHISTGIPHCSACEVAFESKSDFYKHATSYMHAKTDQRTFCGHMIRLASGTRDWDITM